MFPSLRLGRWFGIPVFVHWTFWILPLWATLSLAGSQAGVVPLVYYLVLLAGVFTCVVLHEYGHALAARAFGIRTRDITLYPIGGVASLERMSEKPSEELVIAVAGPAVNVVIAAALTVVLLAGNAVHPVGFAATALGEFLRHLLIVNVAMILFNMIPAFPLDGGRVLRSLLAMKLGLGEATRWAVSVGTTLAIVLPIAMFLRWPEYASPMLIVIAYVVISAGQQELQATLRRERLRDWGAQFTPFVAPSVAAPPVTAPRPPVTVYLLDPETGQWVRQG